MNDVYLFVILDMSIESRWFIKPLETPVRTLFVNLPLTLRWASAGGIIGFSAWISWLRKVIWTQRPTHSLLGSRSDHQLSTRNAGTSTGMLLLMIKVFKGVLSLKTKKIHNYLYFIATSMYEIMPLWNIQTKLNP